jgi:hypothetical protein
MLPLELARGEEGPYVLKLDARRNIYRNELRPGSFECAAELSDATSQALKIISPADDDPWVESHRHSGDSPVMVGRDMLPNGAPQPAKISFLEHSEELRTRLVCMIVALCVGFGICWNRREHLPPK